MRDDQAQVNLLERVKRVLKRAYPQTQDISRNGQAVTIQFTDFKVDVVGGDNIQFFIRRKIFWAIDIHQETSEKIMTSSLKDLSDKRDKLTLASPQVPTLAYLVAKRGIAAGEADFEVDKTK